MVALKTFARSSVLVSACWYGWVYGQATSTATFVDPLTCKSYSTRILYATPAEFVPDVGVGCDKKADPKDKRKEAKKDKPDAPKDAPPARALSEEAKKKVTDADSDADIRAVRKGDQIVVRVPNKDCVFEKIRFEEKERHTRFYDDLHAIIGKIKGVKAAGDCKLEDTYLLEHDRSTLTITAVAKTGEKDNAVITVLTGPKEHLYLGVDIPGTRKTLKYDSSSKTLQPQGDNPQVYLSINYQFGDVVGDHKDFDPWSLDPVSLKVLFLASKRPLDSVGVGVGYQLPKLNAVDLSAISIFGGRFWTKQDDISSSGAPQTNASTARDWRIGVTYDVATGLKWLKSF